MKIEDVDTTIEPTDDAKGPDHARVALATEITFNTLVQTGKHLGLRITPGMGLMFLPTEELTRRFQSVCSDIFVALETP